MRDEIGPRSGPVPARAGARRLLVARGGREGPGRLLSLVSSTSQLRVRRCVPCVSPRAVPSRPTATAPRESGLPARAGTLWQMRSPCWRPPSMSWSSPSSRRPSVVVSCRPPRPKRWPVRPSWTPARSASCSVRPGPRASRPCAGVVPGSRPQEHPNRTRPNAHGASMPAGG